MTSAFIETPRFPDDLAIWARGGTGWSTQVTTVKSGLDQRNSLWTYPKAQFNLASVLRVPAINPQGALYGIQIIRDWIVSMRGQYCGFRFKDFTDYQDETRGTFTAVPNSSTTVFQMAKSYTMGAQSVLRQIRKPLATGIAVYDNASLLVNPTNYTYDSTTGLVTFVVAPTTGHTITWTGQFDIPVRFATDLIEWALAPDGLYDIASIPLIEDRNQ
jgi:uncharacterized protein (TIGR02217 family)